MLDIEPQYQKNYADYRGFFPTRRANVFGHVTKQSQTEPASCVILPAADTRSSLSADVLLENCVYYEVYTL